MNPSTLAHHHESPATATAMLREDHEVILRALALLERQGRALQAGAPASQATLTWLVDFFKTFADRCHHGKEEQHLFPALERYGVPRQGGPIGVMLAEHVEGRSLLGLMGSGDPRVVANAALAYSRMLRAHIEKENGILFPMAEQVLSDEEQQGLRRAFEAVEAEVGGSALHARLLAELGRLEGEAAGAVADSGPGVLDVRPLVPRDRHLRIFEAFDRLGPGESFVLVNDHDPKPLYYQFAAERPGAFAWDYLEQGPEVWRVRIGKPGS